MVKRTRRAALISGILIVVAALGAPAAPTLASHRTLPAAHRAEYQRVMKIITPCLVLYPSVEPLIRAAYARKTLSQPSLAAQGKRIEKACPFLNGYNAPGMGGNHAWYTTGEYIANWLSVMQSTADVLVEGAAPVTIQEPNSKGQWPIQVAMKTDLPLMIHAYNQMRRQLRAFRLYWGISS